MDDIDISWVTDDLRGHCSDVLRALFSLSHVCIITFDARGNVSAVNAHTCAFGSAEDARYRGINLLEHPVLKRLGWAELARRVLAGDRVDVSETRWVTLFSGEERWVDISASPVRHDGEVIGGVVALVDGTARHRAEARAAAKSAQMHELQRFVTTEIARPFAALKKWLSTLSDEGNLTERGSGALEALESSLDDLGALMSISKLEPDRIQPHSLLEALQAAGWKDARSASPAEQALHVYADPHLLQRALRIVLRLGKRMGVGQWRVAEKPGRIEVRLELQGSQGLLSALLSATLLSTTEAAEADMSLAAARWMIEFMDGSLTAEEGALLIDLPRAETARAVA